MFKNIIKVFLILVHTTIFVNAQELTKSQVINIISKQSMLVERMTKAKIYKAHNIENKTSQFEIASSIILFEKNLKFLNKVHYNSLFKTKVTGIKLLWKGFKKTMFREDDNVYLDLLKFNEILLSECNLVYNELLSLSKSSNTYPYNEAADDYFTNAVINNFELKYLSQRLSMYYAAYFFRISKYNHLKFNEIIEIIDLKMLEVTSLNVGENDTIAKINDLEQEWISTKKILLPVLTNKFISTHSSPNPKLVFQKCNQILKKSDKLSRSFKASQSF